MPLNQTEKLKLAALCKEILKLSICGDGKSPPDTSDELVLGNLSTNHASARWRGGQGGRGGVVKAGGVGWSRR